MDPASLINFLSNEEPRGKPRGSSLRKKIFRKLMTIGEEMLILSIDAFNGFHKSLLY